MTEGCEACKLRKCCFVDNFTNDDNQSAFQQSDDGSEADDAQPGIGELSDGLNEDINSQSNEDQSDIINGVDINVRK